MKILAVLFAIFASAIQISAQVVTVDISLESDGYLPNEPIVAKVRIANDSGGTLRLGGAPDWLNFAVAPTEGGYVNPLRLPDLPKDAFELESSKTATVKVDVSPCFDLTKANRYKLTATLKVPSMNASFASPGKNFFISNGTERWRTTFGVPTSIAPANADGQPEQRNYVLIEGNFGAQSRLYARVTDVQNHNLRMVPIGPLLSFSSVEHQTDKWMNLHILYQNGAKSFLYCMINPEGFMLARERHEFTDTKPAMRSNSEGRISVHGGLRRYTATDIPPVDEKLIGPPEQDLSSNYEELHLKQNKPGTKKPAPPENAKKKQ